VRLRPPALYSGPPSQVFSRSRTKPFGFRKSQECQRLDSVRLARAHTGGNDTARPAIHRTSVSTTIPRHSGSLPLFPAAISPHARQITRAQAGLHSGDVTRGQREIPIAPDAPPLQTNSRRLLPWRFSYAGRLSPRSRPCTAGIREPSQQRHLMRDEAARLSEPNFQRSIFPKNGFKYARLKSCGPAG
jgi:hypothetical protein